MTAIESEVAYADVEACADCLVAFDGSDLIMVMPGMSSKAWAKMVIKIEVKAGAGRTPRQPEHHPRHHHLHAGFWSARCARPHVRRTDWLHRADRRRGSGEALKMGEEGNADVLLVHAPASEVAFMDAGFGKDRFLVMHNDFIIVGPADDPAGIKGLRPEDAFQPCTTRRSLRLPRR